MGNRVHILDTYKWTPVRDEGDEIILRGYDLSVRYSREQKDWFNHDSYALADWFNANAECCDLSGDASEWDIELAELESIPDEAYKNPVRGRTEDEMRRFVAECIRCAKLTEGECHLEWW